MDMKTTALGQEWTIKKMEDKVDSNPDNIDDLRALASYCEQERAFLQSQVDKREWDTDSLEVAQEYARYWGKCKERLDKQIESLQDAERYPEATAMLQAQYRSYHGALQLAMENLDDARCEEAWEKVQVYANRVANNAAKMAALKRSWNTLIS